MLLYHRKGHMPALVTYLDSAHPFCVTEKIASMSQPIAAMCKETVNAAYELTLREGCHFERRIFHATFATVCARSIPPQTQVVMGNIGQR